VTCIDGTLYVRRPYGLYSLRNSWRCLATGAIRANLQIVNRLFVGLTPKRSITVANEKAHTGVEIAAKERRLSWSGLRLSGALYVRCVSATGSVLALPRRLLIVALASLVLLCLLVSSRPAEAQSCGVSTDCPGWIWYAVIPIDSACFQLASAQELNCEHGVPADTPTEILGGIACCYSQYDIALCACPPPGPPTPAGPAGYPSGNPAPVPGHGCDAGESADPGTGIFTYQQTDLTLADVTPIQLARSYRESDGVSRAFGVGMALNYDLEIVEDPSGSYQYVDLVLPDGAQVHYPRITPGGDFLDGVYQHTSSPTIYYGSTISWNGNAWVLARKDGTTMTFGSYAMLTSITDRNGNTVQIQRPNESAQWPNDNATLITSPNGRWISLTYAGYGDWSQNERVVSAQDNTGRTVYFSYDSTDHLSKVYDANGGTTTYAYDSAGRMASYTTPNGDVAIQNVYDRNNRVITQTRADGGVFNFSYTAAADGNPETNMTGTRGMTCSMEFSPNGYLVNDVWAGGTAQQQTMSHVRDPNTNLVDSTTDMLGRMTSFTYDSMGNVISETRLAGTSQASTTSSTFDPQFNQLTSSTDALGRTWNYNLDANGNVLSVTDPLGHQQAAMTYNTQGQAITSTDATGSATQFAYTNGTLSSTTDPLGDTTSFTADTAGHLVRSVDPMGNANTVYYDALGHQTQIIAANGAITAFTYDPDGNLTSMTDANGGTTTYSYDSMDRLIAHTDPLGATAHYDYDTSGNLTQFTDRKGNVTVYQYDLLDRKIFAGFGQNGSQYDSTVTYMYDQADRLTQIVDSVYGTITRTYDGMDDLIEEQTPLGEMSYNYDAAHRLLSTTVDGQAPITYSYDGVDHLTGMTQGGVSASFSYDASGRRTQAVLPNGVAVAYGYDVGPRINQLTWSGTEGQIGNLGYVYDADGRVIQKTGSFAQVVLPQTISGNTFNAANQMVAFNGTPITYDANGNLTNDGTNTYAWDERNRLVGMSGSPGGPASFAYDPFGRRASKTVGGTTTQFQYDGNRVVQEIQPGAGNVLTNMGFSRTDLAGNMTFLFDSLGSTVALASDAGTVDTQYSYEPFGASLASGPPSNNPYQFAFHQNDGTGLYYYSARYYSPTLARFISEDPSGTRGGINLYEYAGDQPVTFEDAAGLSPSDGSGSCRPCKIKLMYHQVWFVPRFAAEKNHFFWATWKEGGTDLRTDSGETLNGPYLDEKQNVDTDNPYLPNQQLFENETSTEICDQVDRLRNAADTWGNEITRYNVFGPNSNTIASYIYHLSGIGSLENFNLQPNDDLAPGWRLGAAY
jgi:RHS repeat-associated protein